MDYVYITLYLSKHFVSVCLHRLLMGVEGFTPHVNVSYVGGRGTAAGIVFDL